MIFFAFFCFSTFFPLFCLFFLFTFFSHFFHTFFFTFYQKKNCVSPSICFFFKKKHFFMFFFHRCFTFCFTFFSTFLLEMTIGVHMLWKCRDSLADASETYGLSCLKNEPVLHGACAWALALQMSILRQRALIQRNEDRNHQIERSANLGWLPLWFASCLPLVSAPLQRQVSLLASWPARRCTQRQTWKFFLRIMPFDFRVDGLDTWLHPFASVSCRPLQAAKSNDRHLHRDV